MYDYVGIDQVPKKGLPIIAIPTTAGTGSECTAIAIFANEKLNVKQGLVSPFLMPNIALIDPALTLSCPPNVTAASGMDALIHNIEAYISVNATMHTDSLAYEGIKLISQSIRTAVYDGSNMWARDNMAMGSMMGGIAFGNAGVGAVHALSYPIGGMFHVPHGVANTMVLPWAMEFNMLACLRWFRQIGEAMGENMDGLSDREAADKTVAALRLLADDLGVPQYLSDVDIPESAIPDLVEGAKTQARLWNNNPRKFTPEDMEQVYRNMAVRPGARSRPRSPRPSDARRRPRRSPSGGGGRRIGAGAARERRARPFAYHEARSVPRPAHGGPTCTTGAHDWQTRFGRTEPKIVCVGLNYTDHAAEQGAKLPANPMLFAKFANALCGDGDDIVLSAGIGHVDAEAELCVVIGREAHDVPADDALDVVHGYLCGNDVSARDLQFGDRQWFRGKSQDTFCPIGPGIVPVSELGDAGDLRVVAAAQRRDAAGLAHEQPHLRRAHAGRVHLARPHPAARRPHHDGHAGGRGRVPRPQALDEARRRRRGRGRGHRRAAQPRQGRRRRRLAATDSAAAGEPAAPRRPTRRLSPPAVTRLPCGTTRQRAPGPVAVQRGRHRVVDGRERRHAHAAHHVVGELRDEVDVGARQQPGDGRGLVAAEHELLLDAVDEHLRACPSRVIHSSNDLLPEALAAAGDEHDHAAVAHRAADVVERLLRLVEVDVLGRAAGRGDRRRRRPRGCAGRSAGRRRRRRRGAPPGSGRPRRG